jgi:hypothetical protein
MPASASHSSTERIAAAGRARDDVLLQGALPDGLLRRIGLTSGDHTRPALLFGLIGWAPLVALALLQSAVLRIDDISPLLWDIGVHVRYLVAVPLLVLACGTCASQLDAIVRHFIRSRIAIDPHAVTRVVTSTQVLSMSPVAEIAAVVLAYASVAAAVLSYTDERLPAWATSDGIAPIYSLAGWWHMLVSLPLLLVLVFGWILRVVLWMRLLWQISRLELRLVTPHPDRCGGLGFLGHSLRAFSIVALALASITAARSANLVLEGASLPTSNLYFSVGLMLSMTALFVAPLFAFTPVLMRAWRRATFEYGTLAGQVSRAFEDKWLDGRKVDPSALAQSDFSAAADLYSVVANVHAIRFVPLDLKDLIALVAAIALPFLPVLLLSVPISQILANIRGLLF